MAGDTAKVVMVRCPKCAHLLPELSRYAVYRCGGCGSLLKAEKEPSVRDDRSDRSGDGRVGGIDVERRAPGRVSKSPVRSRYGGANGKSPLRGRMSSDFDDQSRSSGRSADGDDRRTPLRRPAVAANPEEIEARDKVGGWLEHVKEEEGGYANKLVMPTESFNGWLPGEETINQDKTEVNVPSGSPRKRRTWNKEDPSIGFGPKQVPEQVGRVTDENGEVHSNLHGRNHAEVADVSFTEWVEEDGYGGRRRSTDLRNRDGYVEVFEGPRGRMEHRDAERIGYRGVHGNDMLPSVRQRVPIDPYEAPSSYHSGSYYGHDEVRSSRSHSHYNGPANLQNVAMKQAELIRKYNELGQELYRISPLSYDHDDYVHDEYLSVGRGSVQSSGPNVGSRMRHDYITGHPVPGRSGGRYEEDNLNFPPPRFMPNEGPFHDDPSSARAPRRSNHREPLYRHQQYAPRRPMDSTYGPRTENLHPQHPDVYDYKHLNNQAHQAPDYADENIKRPVDSTLRNPTPNNLSSISRSSVDSKSSVASSLPDRAKKVLVVGQHQQICRPIAGGAPFVTCSKCFQLLRLPGKLRTMKKNQCRLQCGSCRTILSFDFEKKRSHASAQTNPPPNATDVSDIPSEAVSKSDDKNTHHKSDAALTTSESYDFKSAGDTFPNSDSERSAELDVQKLSEAKMRPGLSPSSSNASKDDTFEAIGQTDAPPSKADKPLTNGLGPLRPPPGSPLRYHFDYSDVLHGKESGVQEIDKGPAERDSSSLNYLESAAVPTDEIPKTKASQGSIGASIRRDQAGNRGSQDLSVPSINLSPAEPDVFVNGQPITHDAVTRAEKMAGPIRPGDYWYDSKAGFWGLKGSHCLGIVAPFIKEFRAPMQENCSGGDTCIYVNKRELHKNDLDLLASRRLPRTRYKYYIIDLSGKVEDEDTGRFVVNLGKLAPNVEKRGCGFGMQPPEMQYD